MTKKVLDTFLQFLDKQKELIEKKNLYEEQKKKKPIVSENESISKCKGKKQPKLEEGEVQGGEDDAIPLNFCRVINHVKRSIDPKDEKNYFELIYICSSKVMFFKKMVDKIKEDYINNLQENPHYKKIPSLGDNLEYKVTLQSDDRDLYHGKIIVSKEIMQFEIDNFYTRYAISYDMIKDCKIYR